jgi:capsular exopolysaccharide synthesis family protein
MSLSEPKVSAAHQGPDQAGLEVVPAAPLVVPAREDVIVQADALPPALTEPVSPLTLFQAMRRRWAQALPVGLLLAALAGGLVWFLRPDKYTAYALLQIAPVEQKILQDSGARPETDRTGLYQKTQAALIKSRPVLQAALKQEKVRHLPLVREQADAATWLEKELKAELVENTELLRLSLTSRQHQGDLAPVVNAVQEAYLTEIVKGEQAHQMALLNDMEQIYASSQEKLRAQRESLRRLADTLKTGDSQILTIKQKNLLEEYASLKKELAGVVSRVRDAEVKLAAQRLDLAPAASGSAPAGATLDAAVDREVDADPVVQKQREAVYALEQKLAAIDQVNRNRSLPARVDAQDRVDAARGVLEKMRAERRQAVTERVAKGLAADRQLHAREVEEEMRVLRRQRDALQGEVANLGRDVDRMGVSSVELELKRNEIDQAEAVLRALRNEKERLQVELQATAKRRVTLLAPAEEATVLDQKSHPLEAVGAACVGLLLGLFGVSYRELRARKLYTPAQVSRGLGLPVVGTLPALPARRLGLPATVPGSSGPAWERILAESVDSIRTVLVEGRLASGGSLVMITSACSGEGKTTLAGALAASLARGGRRTLLVDGDLRNPALGRLFDVPRSPGLCELLSRTAEVAEVVRPTPVDGLSLLPAGTYSGAAATGLARGDHQTIFRELRGRFDFIVVDSSPVLAVSDALLVGKGADGVVFSVRPGVSQAPQVYAAYERLRDLGLPFIGTVVNGVRDRALYAPNYRYLARASA